MFTTSNRRTLATVAAGALFALPVVAQADPPALNLPASGSGTHLLRDYSQNAAGGLYAPALKVTPARSQQPASAPGDGFSWGDATAGAAVAIVLGAGAAIGRRAVVRRRGSLRGVMRA